ncbi:magnesium and cobalt transporter [Shimia isoporae]|uniref:Magnesium and cobalt transporter n=1 Tax=Shimia isoporae TaxID=647720 RepID=A0A4R1NUL0_9RHOB|nr:hemolysin family protein [Shimia isoporae]TCL08732.1 magnesium and cobalt transporter [Shimia isoporae]
MGDTIDGSSNAALSARPEGQHQKKGGWIARLFSKSAEMPEAINGAQAAPAPASQPHGMINLRRMRVEDVAVPKADIVAVPNTISETELLQVFRDSGMTRLPVYDGTLDTPIGFVHLKDFALRHGFNGDTRSLEIDKMLRPLLFVPPSMAIGVLLAKMQAERRHMALVIDEYGGVDGLATIEDLIEQVIGEIEDEHDAEEADFWVQERPGSYLALSKTPLEDFEAAIGRSLTHHEDIDREEIDTLGGLVFMLCGHVPARGEVVELPDGLSFEVVDADPRRIKRLRVLLPAEAANG